MQFDGNFYKVFPKNLSSISKMFFLQHSLILKFLGISAQATIRGLEQMDFERPKMKKSQNH